MDISAGLAPYLANHCVRGRILLPATAYLEMALAAAEEAFGNGPHALEDINFCEALVLPQDRTLARTMQLIISNEVSGAASFQFFSLNAGATKRQASWTLHARGKIRLLNPQAHASQTT
jgi:acyl transferase domain-containing protein